jgi:hypothetical protein
VRCFCGNPLLPAVFTPSAKCSGCPPHYSPPRQCKFGHFDDYDDTYYRRDYYSNGDYDEVYIRRHRSSRYSHCYEAYPDPPTVSIVDVFRAPPEPEPAPAPTPTVPTPAPEPSGLQCDPPRSQLEAEQCAGHDQTPAPEPQPQPEPEPAPEPDICNDGQDNEGVPGLIDHDDPNCQ